MRQVVVKDKTQQLLFLDHAGFRFLLRTIKDAGLIADSLAVYPNSPIRKAVNGDGSVSVGAIDALFVGHGGFVGRYRAVLCCPAKSSSAVSGLYEVKHPSGSANHLPATCQ